MSEADKAIRQSKEPGRWPTPQSAAPARCPTCGSGGGAAAAEVRSGCRDPWHLTAPVHIEPSSETPLQQAVDSMEGPMREPSPESPALDDVGVVRDFLEGLHQTLEDPRYEPDGPVWDIVQEKAQQLVPVFDRLSERLRRAERERDLYRGAADSLSVIGDDALTRVTELETKLQAAEAALRETYHRTAVLVGSTMRCGFCEQPDYEPHIPGCRSHRSFCYRQGQLRGKDEHEPTPAPSRRMEPVRPVPLPVAPLAGHPPHQSHGREPIVNPLEIIEKAVSRELRRVAVDAMLNGTAANVERDHEVVEALTQLRVLVDAARDLQGTIDAADPEYLWRYLFEFGLAGKFAESLQPFIEETGD